MLGKQTIFYSVLCCQHFFFFFFWNVVFLLAMSIKYRSMSPVSDDNKMKEITREMKFKINAQ